MLSCFARLACLRPPACRRNATQNCAANETYPGLFEVPVWQLTQLGGPYTQNPGG